MATYSTDLTTYTTAESGTWTEFGSANTGGSPAADGENFIQGTDCRSQTTGTKSGASNPKSVVFNNGSDPSGSWTTDDVFFIWCYYAVGVNLFTYASDGHQVGIANDTTNVDRFTVGGSDYGRNPYGGWFNAAVDPTATADNTYGTGGAGYQYVGSIVYTTNAISKGTPHAVDAIRYGRGEISVTGSGGTFSELAEYNDYNAGGTPPGTSSTSVDSGRHRLGLFQDAGGTYLWKGLMSMGLTGTSVTWSDSNAAILIDDTAKTYAAFNKVEINNSSSSVTWTGVSMTALGTVAKGQFEVVDNATVSLDACTFTDMDAFTFNDGTNSNTITDSVFRRCGLITTGGATFTGCTFDELTGAVGVTASSPANAAKISNSTFASDGTGNGLEVTGTAANFTLTSVNFTGYSTTVDANKAIYVNIATGTVNLTISGGSGVTASSHVRTAGATVNVITNAVVTKITAEDQDGNALENVRVFLETSDNGGGSGFPYQASVSTLTQTGGTATLTASSAHGLSTNDYVVVRGANDEYYNKTAQITVTSTTVFTYSVNTSAGASAGGTPVFSYCPLSGLTSTTGVIQSTKSWPASQGCTGWARKSTSSPYYKTSPISISDASGGTDALVLMILDE
jgi:hypothetical protein